MKKPIEIFSFKLFFAICLLLLPAGMIFAEESKNEPAYLDADTIEYDMRTDLVTAVGDVLMKRGSARVSGQKAVYNVKTQEGVVEDKVIAVRENLRLTCRKLISDGTEHMKAIGGVHATELDRTFIGEEIEYFPKQNDYIIIPAGGRLTSKDGVFTANKLEGWIKDEHYIGTGNAHLISPPRNLEAGGDRLDYFGKEEKKAVLTGSAWAIQENHVVRGNRLTIFLTQDGKTTVKK